MKTTLTDNSIMLRVLQSVEMTECALLPATLQVFDAQRLEEMIARYVIVHTHDRGLPVL